MVKRGGRRRGEGGGGREENEEGGGGVSSKQTPPISKVSAEWNLGSDGSAPVLRLKQASTHEKYLCMHGI